MHAGLLSNPRRGFFTITPTGKELLQENPSRIDVNLLLRYPNFAEFRSRRTTGEAPTSEPSMGDGETPEDSLAAAYQLLRDGLETELLQQIKDSSPSFFERLVVDLLVKMGYGGSRQEAGRAIGRSGDGGIDGVIDEDRLGLDVYTFRPSVGTLLSAVQRYRDLPVPFRASALVKESSSPLRASAKMPKTMPLV